MAEWNATVRPYAALSSSLHLPTGSLSNSLSWLLWIERQRTWDDRCLFDMQISFLLDICPEVGLRDHMVNLFGVILFYGGGGAGGGFHAVFHCGYGNLHSKQQYIGNPSHLLPSIYLFIFMWVLIDFDNSRSDWNRMAVLFDLVCIDQGANAIEHFLILVDSLYF